MTFKNKTFQKFIACLLIVFILAPAGFVMFSKPPKTEAFLGILDVNFQALDFQEIVWKVLEQVLKYIAKKLADKIAQSTVNWINGGFQGKPAFIENPGSFFNDIKKNELKSFVTQIGSDDVRFPFGKDVARELIDQARRTFEESATYRGYDDPIKTAYVRDNFSAGGLDGILDNTMNIQNNFIGFGILAKKEINNRLSGPTSSVAKVRDVLDKGVGFLNQEKCASNPGWNPDKLNDGLPLDAIPKFSPPKFDPTKTPAENVAAGKAYSDSYEKTKTEIENKFQNDYGCPEGPATVTPGSVVSSEIQKALGGKKDSLNLAANLGNIVGVVLDALVAKFERDGLAGLNKLLTPPPPKPPAEYNYKDKKTGTDYATPNYDYNADDPNSSPLSTNPPIKISLNIINDDSGTLQSSQVKIYVDGNETTNDDLSLYSSGTHTVSINNPPGYTVMFGGSCNVDGSITITSSVAPSTCTITLDDISTTTTSQTARLTVKKLVINDNGGTLSPTDVQLFVDGDLKLSGKTYVYPVGTHVVSEENVAGYASTIGGDCSPNGYITLALDDVKECTITNDDI